MFNLGQTDYQVCRGDRVAQLVIERICTPELVEVEVGSCNTILIEKYIDATKCWLILRCFIFTTHVVRTFQTTVDRTWDWNTVQQVAMPKWQ